MTSIKINFTNKTNINLSANLEMPVDHKPLAFAIFAHCFTCSKNLSAVINISRALNQRGIAVLRFDFTGLGNSDGDFSDSNFSTSIDDLVAAYEYLKNNYKAPALIIGHSLGGTAVLKSSSIMKDLKAIVTIGAPADPDHVQNLFKEDLDEIKKKGVATVSIGGRPFKIKEQLIQDLESVDLKETIASLKQSLLIFHSPQDDIVDISNAKKIFSLAKHPKSFISLDKADHLLTNKEDSLYAGEVIASWAMRYLEIKPISVLKTDMQVVVKTGIGSYVTEIKAGGHGLIADEPLSAGGTDQGPNPYDLLISGLGSCTSMTLRMYADRKGWDLQEVRVHLQHDKIHSIDCNNCENTSGKIDQIERKIELIGNLSSEEKQRLLEIADRCPVHKTLNSKVKIKTSLKA
jgi:uncharacterized OsmC-like protein/esterase/lipase